MKNNAIMHKEAFYVAGQSMTAVEQDPKIPGFWDSYMASDLAGKLQGIGTGDYFGVSYAKSKEPKFKYMAGVKVKEILPALKAGAEILHISESDYFVQKAKGKIPESIFAAWKEALAAIEKAGLTVRNAPDLEYYLPGEVGADDYEMEIWIPIEKVQD